ncbi:E3 ubiquitin-protein ligase TRIM39 [Acipenser ruthenus]|uniref:E3 ubiquitin-protein ligase TRIM39 n=2 Tax=Acipenser ruthenus TaxID=7906 RepID=A0A662YSK5_ACIRT|nr:E3 ubiquitin-protein ligase TRIM39 [Acipenser ruthenus]
MLRKVGLYLDYENGCLSFYNMEIPSHIYSFNDTFTEKLYPVFYAVDNTSLVIADPVCTEYYKTLLPELG